MRRKQLDVRKRRKCCKIRENKNKHSSQHTIVVSTNTSKNYSVSGTEGLYDFRKKKSRTYYQYQHGNRKDHLVRTIKKQQKNQQDSLIFADVRWVVQCFRTYLNIPDELLCWCFDGHFAVYGSLDGVGPAHGFIQHFGIKTVRVFASVHDYVPVT